MSALTKQDVKNFISQNDVKELKALFENKQLSIRKHCLKNGDGNEIRLCVCVFQRVKQEMGLFLVKTGIDFKERCSHCDEKQYRNSDALLSLLRKVCKE